MSREPVRIVDATELRSLLLLGHLALDAPAPAQALRAGAAQSRWRAPLVAAAHSLADALDRGEGPSTALAPHVPSHVVAALAAGERTGGAHSAFERALATTARAAEPAGRSRAARSWPLVTFSLACLMSALLAWQALPPFGAMLTMWKEDLDLPWGGDLVIRIAELHRAAAVTLLGLAAVPWLVGAMLRAMATSRHLSPLVAGLPIVGRAVRHAAAADRLDVFARLLTAGLPPHEAHALAAEVIAVPAMRSRARLTTKLLLAGEPAATAFRDSGLPRTVLHFLALGDYSVRALEDAATFAQHEAERAAREWQLLGEALAFCGTVVLALGIALVLLTPARTLG